MTSCRQTLHLFQRRFQQGQLEWCAVPSRLAVSRGICVSRPVAVGRVRPLRAPRMPASLHCTCRRTASMAFGKALIDSGARRQLHSCMFQARSHSSPTSSARTQKPQFKALALAFVDCPLFLSASSVSSLPVHHHSAVECVVPPPGNSLRSI